jgi:hypothetical protein
MHNQPSFVFSYYMRSIKISLVLTQSWSTVGLKKGGNKRSRPLHVMGGTIHTYNALAKLRSWTIRVCRKHSGPNILY